MDVYRASLTVNGHTTHRLVVSRYIVESSAYLPPTVVSSVFFDPKFSHPNRSPRTRGGNNSIFTFPYNLYRENPPNLRSPGTRGGNNSRGVITQGYQLMVVSRAA